MNIERLESLQIAVVAMIGCAVLLAMVTVPLSGFEHATQMRFHGIAIFGASVGLIGAIMARIVTRTMDRNTEGWLQLEEGPVRMDDVWLLRFQQRTLVGCALLEGCCLLSLILNLLRPSLLLVVTAAILIFFMTFLFPAKERAERWWNSRKDRAASLKEAESFQRL